MSSSSYATLYAKYQQALVSIRELEQLSENRQQQLEDYKTAQTKLEKSTAQLCETILKKDRGKNDERIWFKMTLQDKVDSAQSSIERYFPEIEELITKLMTHNSDRTEKIDKLTTELHHLKMLHKKEIKDLTASKDEAIKKLSLKLKTGRMDEESIQRIVEESVPVTQKEKPNMNMDSMSISTEPEDGIQEEVISTIYAQYRSGEKVMKAKGGPKVKSNPSVKSAAKNAQETIQTDFDNQMEIRSKELKDEEKLVIRFMGETGFSEAAVIISGVRENNSDLVRSESIAKHALFALSSAEPSEKETAYVKVLKVAVPGSPNFAVYKLNSMGENMFRYLFIKEPVESEIDTLLRHHGTEEHGFSIKKTAEMLQKSSYFKKNCTEAIYLTREKKYMQSVDKEQGSIPDIILIHKNRKETYIEYETGNCKETDLIAKCTKAVFLHGVINIVVPNDAVKSKVKCRVERWKNLILERSVNFPGNTDAKNVFVNISTFNELKTNAEKETLVWGEHIKIKRPTDTEIRKPAGAEKKGVPYGLSTDFTII